ncbi:MAG: winged helix-turn-helix transcriptional regulator [Meiothermus sp.]|nr:winged helix-turn-helix transcriptional regulator [Meiothermus sp.]
MSIPKFDSSVSQKALALARLLHWRWSLPVLSLLWLEQGAKFVLLVGRLGLSRDALSRTLGGLIELGYVEKNPGYGHPLRPEYLLTLEGEGIAQALTRLLHLLKTHQVEDAALNKWSLPTLWLVGQGQARFSQLQSLLPGVSPRAVALALADLEGAGLLERQGEKRPSYSLSPKGLEVWEKVQGLLEAL